MEAKELRIGNYIEYYIPTDDLRWQRTLIDWQDLKMLLEQPESFNKEHRPILLTEEWLFTFGFEKGDDIIGDCFFIETEKVEDISLYWSKNDNCFIYDLTKIQYVHQLQNLYFALTNQELQTNENK